jgi:hypothetical protein
MSLIHRVGGIILPTKLIPGGAAKPQDPLFWYRGEDAYGSLWRARYGSDLTETHATTGPTFGRSQSPLGAKDTSVLFNADARFVAAAAGTYDFTTSDFAFLCAFYQKNEATYRVLFGKSIYASSNEQGYWARVNSDHTIAFRWSTLAGAGATATGAALSGGDLDAWHLLMGFVDQDENSASSLRLYLDGARYASATLNLGSSSITCSSKFAIGAQGQFNSSSPFDGDLALLAGWYAAQGWWPGGTANDALWDQLAREYYGYFINGFPMVA